MINRRLSSKGKNLDPIIRPVAVITATINVLNYIHNGVARLSPYRKIFDGDVFGRDKVTANEVKRWTLGSVSNAT